MEIKGRQVLKVRLISEGHDYDKESKMKDEKYNRYVYNGKVFICNAKDPFVKVQKAGKLYSVELDANEEGQLSMVGWTSTDEEITMAKTEATLLSFSASLADAQLDDATVEALKEE